jgi:hypothetical protein
MYIIYDWIVEILATLQLDLAVAVSLLNKGYPPSHPCDPIAALVNYLKMKGQ